MKAIKALKSQSKLLAGLLGTKKKQKESFNEGGGCRLYRGEDLKSWLQCNPAPDRGL